MTIERGVDDPRDQFPIGMRVLAVDDDATCLFLLETLLRRCQYHVTTTSQSTTALKMLRENKNKFDLVISDVHMPDMDGFKLLELVGLEMDLPVIMLSGNGDTKLVMKGITHGACDYLLKPVRIEELKNIWQHVLRRKKVDPKDQTNCGNRDKSHGGSGEGGQWSVGMENSDQNAKVNRKRKDQNEIEDEDEDHDEDGYDNDDPSSQKKPRVVWSIELHRKFVAAVNQLGIDKAVPKKILDLMNVEKLTRENVASHLQKYRLYLKRISCVANQQANMVAALGSSDSSYLRMGSLNGVGNFHALTGPGQFHNPAFRSFPPSGMIGRLNTSSGLGLHCLPSSGMVQLGHAQNSSNSINDPPAIFSGNCNGNMLQGTFELNQQHGNGTPVFPISSGLPDAKVTINSSNDALGLMDNPFLRRPQDSDGGRKYVNQSSVPMASLKSEFSSPFLDHGRLSGNWSSAAQSSGFRSNSFPLSDSFKQSTMPLSNMRDNMPVMSSQIGSSQFDVPSVISISSQSQDSRSEIQTQASAFSSNAGQTINSEPFQGWDDHKQDSLYHSDVMCSSMNSLMPVNDTVAPFDQNLHSKSTIFQRNMDFNSIGQSNVLDPLLVKYDEVEKSVIESSLKLKQLKQLKQGYLGDQQQPQGSYITNNFGSLDDLVSAMMKQERR